MLPLIAQNKMAKKTKRQKAIKRLNLSDHTLDINILRCNYFSFSEIEEYVRELVERRDYQYDAIKHIKIYPLPLARRLQEHYRSRKKDYQDKLQIQHRFGTPNGSLESPNEIAYAANSLLLHDTKRLCTNDGDICFSF